MAAYSGKLLLIKKNTGTSGSPTWTTVTGMQTKSIRINNDLVEITNDQSTNKEYLAGAGVTDFEVNGEGVWKDDAVNQAFVADAIARTEDQYQVIVPGLGTFDGYMVPRTTDLSGTTKAETRWSFGLLATGDITFTAE